MLERLAEGPERDRMELDLQTVLGSVYMRYAGYGATEGEQAYSRANALFDQLALKDPERRFLVLSGLRRSYTHRGRYEDGEHVSRQCLSIQLLWAVRKFLLKKFITKHQMLCGDTMVTTAASAL